MEIKHAPEIEQNKIEVTDDGFSEKKLARARERFGGKNLVAQVKQAARKIRKAKKKEEVSRRDII